MVKLSVKIGKMRLKNPAMSASGTFGPEYGELVDINSLGALVLKTITLNARTGNPPPRIAETASGMLNSIGLENKGVDDFIKNKMPLLKNITIPIIASIAGDNKSEYEELAKRLNKVRGISALEINLSCPNVKHGNRKGLIAQDEEAVYEVIEAVRETASLTVIAKLSPNVADIAGIARIAESAGADAVLIANTFPAMAVDIGTKMPKLGNITGGLSGPAIKPIALKMVWDVYSEVKIPIIASGGIMDYKDAVEFMLCGAIAVQIGTANFVNPGTGQEIVKGIAKYLRSNKMDSVKKLVGGMKSL